ncbi:RusA family crossover junction endodeoxyribonuclease [Enterococcus faecalis]|nr:RusA family crossover junction endodeoxyribonuclease [Enterococcus faecalis]
MWTAEIPFNPIATPRPSFRKIGKDNVTAYYPSSYKEYQKKVSDYLLENRLLDESFYETIKSELGVIMEVDFFLKIPKNQNQVHRIFRTTAPDIDNLLKCIMDCLFQDTKERDSRVVGVVAFKHNTKQKPRTIVRLKSANDFSDQEQNGLIDEDNWQIVIPMNPKATPRPSVKMLPGKTITYYGNDYKEYLLDLQNHIEKEGMYNSTFYDVAKAEFGVIAEIDYYCKIPKNQKNAKRILKTTAPDIDNYVKATLDGLFNKDTGLKDSRVVGLIAFKFNTAKHPRTEIRLRGV